jgi:perosamine synthetase
MFKPKKILRLFKPSVGREEIAAIKKVFKQSWLGYGSEVKKFEKKFSNFIGSKYAVGLNSCTAALHIALAVNNFKPKKKVLVPSITFSASAAAALYCNLTPVFVDTEKDSLNIDFEDLKRKYTKDCVAVITVHFGGHPCAMEKIVPWAKKKGLITIEDCAHTCGGYYKGKKLGNWGDYGCFSFEDKKTITTGDGGMLTTNKKDKISLIRSLSFHGWSSDPYTRHLHGPGKKHWYYEMKNLGFKYNMNNLLAAIGIEQLKKLNKLNSKRTKILNRYIKEIKNCKTFITAYPYALKKSCYWLFSLRTKYRDEFINFLKDKKISSGVHLMPLPLHPLYKKYNKNITIATKTWKELVTLPCFPDMKDKEVNYVIKTIKEFDKKITQYNPRP